MSYAIARLVSAAMFMEALLLGQQTVCALFKDLKAADGRQLILTGDLIVSQKENIAALGAEDCDNRYIAPMEGPGTISRIWPTAVRLRPSPAAPPAQLMAFRAAAVEADRLRAAGKTVAASALFSGRIEVHEADDFPAEFTFDSVSDLKVEALPDASTLPVIPICELFQNLPAWKGKRIAVRGESVGTSEGTWLVGRCTGGFVTNGYRWPVSLNSAGPAYVSPSTARLVEPKKPTSPPKGEKMFRGRHNAVENVTYVGRLRMRDKYMAECRGGGQYITNGFGHLNGSAAELIVEEVRDVELTKAPPPEETEHDAICQPPNFAALCAASTSLRERHLWAVPAG